MKNSYPIAYDKAGDAGNFFANSACYWALGNGGLNPDIDKDAGAIPQKDVELIMASGGYYGSVEDANKRFGANENTKLNVLLNNASASFRGGMVCCPDKDGDYVLMCTRNNNFTNR